MASRVESGLSSLGRGLFSLLSGWFPAGATIFQPYMSHLTPSSNRTCDFPAYGFPIAFVFGLSQGVFRSSRRQPPAHISG
jgi:hypothetical protein